MIVLTKLLNENAKIPKKAYPTDFCYDVWATSEEEIAPNVWKYGTGLSFQILDDTSWYPTDNVTFSIDLRPRSSIWKTGMVLSNSIGTVDYSYRGEICFIFYHVFPDMPRYKVGDKIGQLKLGDGENIKFFLADTLDESDRGDGGFGSTGN